MRGCVAIHLQHGLQGLNDNAARGFARAFLEVSGTQKHEVDLRGTRGGYFLLVCDGPFVQSDLWTEYEAMDILQRATKQSGVEVRKISFECGGS